MVSQCFCDSYSRVAVGATNRWPGLFVGFDFVGLYFVGLYFVGWYLVGLCFGGLVEMSVCLSLGMLLRYLICLCQRIPSLILL